MSILLFFIGFLIGFLISRFIIIPLIERYFNKKHGVDSSDEVYDGDWP